MRKESVDYIRDFLAADVLGPESEEDDRSSFKRASRRRAALYATLIKAGLTPPSGFRARFPVNSSVLNEVNQKLSGRPDGMQLSSDARGVLTLSPTQLRAFWDGLVE